MSPEERDDLSKSIESYVERSVRDLFESKPEDYYYITLSTTGEARAPVLSAWSQQSLEAVPPEDRPLLKWSYADSPHYHFGESYFDDLEVVFRRRPSPNELSEHDWKTEVNARIAAMEDAVARLDSRGLFGSGARRDKLLIAVEVMPPDASNIARITRLNAGTRLDEWLSETAEST